MDDNFSSDSYLSIYNPFDTSNDIKESKPIFTALAPGKFTSIDWSKPSDDYPLGLLACGLENSTIQIYNPNILISSKSSNLIDSRIAEYSKHTTPVLKVKFNPLQSNILASSGSKGEIFIWDIKKGSSFNPGQSISPISKVSSLAWNNVMPHIFATAGDNGYTSIWDLKAKREVLQLNYSNINLSTVQWHPNQSTKLVTASDVDSDPVILTWDLRNSSVPEKIMKGHKKGVLSLDWCLDDSNLLLSSGRDDSTLLWNPIEGIQLASYPLSSNWVHETKFAPKIPEIIASASLSKKIIIQSLQDTSKPDINKVKSQNENDFWNEISTVETQQPTIKIQQAPIWLKRPVSANFGYGGKLVITKNKEIKIVSISKDGSIDNLAKEMITAIATKDFNNLCDLKIKSNENETLKENSDWNLLKKILDNTSIESLLNIQENKDEIQTTSDPNNETRSSSNIGDLIDDDEFFAQIGNSNNINNSIVDTNYIPNGKFDLFSKSSDEFENDAIKLLMANKTDELLDLCIKKDHILEALVLVLNGSEKAKEKASSAYFKKFAEKSSFARLLYSSSTNSLSDVVKNADISSWKEIAKSIITFSKGKASFNVEMKLLGDRLLDSGLEDSRNSALSCYIVANALDKVSSVWLSELSDYESFYLKNENGSKNTAFEARFKALGEVIEKIVVFQSKTSSSLTGDLSGLGKAFVEYADSLVNFGHHELAYKLLNLITDSIPEIKIEKDRISKAFISTKTLPSTNKNNYGVPKSSNMVPLPNVSMVSGQQTTLQQTQPPLQTVPPQSQRQSISSQKRVKNPYVIPDSLTSSSIPTPPVNLPPTNLHPSSNAGFQQHQFQPNPYFNNTNANQQVAQSYPANGNMINNTTVPPAKANPYAPNPKTALDSLKNSNYTNGVESTLAPPPQFKKELPPSMKKNIEGWNDLPTHLAPTIKRATPTQPVVNNFMKHTSSRSVSQAPAIPPPPSRQASEQIAQPIASVPISRVSSMSKNPYAPKPEVIEPVRSPVYPRSPFTPQPSGSAIKTSNPSKNPYAPKNVTNSYTEASVQQQQQPLHQIPNTTFNANSMPPPPAYAKPATSIPPPPPQLVKKTNISSPTPISGNHLPDLASVVNAVPSKPGSPENSSGSLHIQPIISILSEELEKVRPKIPAKFNKQLTDAEKRIDILFQHLKKGDLLTDSTIERLVNLATSLRDGEYAKALAIRDEISTASPEQCGDWMVGVNRLIGMVQATSPSCENNIKILTNIDKSDDSLFELSCIKNRLDSLIPILESTEKLIRMEHLPILHSDSNIEMSSSIKKIMPSLEEVSLNLWNVINFKQKECEDNLEDKRSWKTEFKNMMNLKYFNSLLLSLYALLDIFNGKSKIRCLKCLLKSYYECIDVNDLVTGKQIKEYVEKLCNYLEQFKFEFEDNKVYQTLKLEFFILDMQSALLSNNVSMAKFYENKANIVDKCENMKPENVFNICRAFYNDGLKLYKEENYLDSHYFLQKCYLILEKMNIPKSLIAENKIRSSTLIMLAKCCIKINNKESFNEATKLLKLLQLNETDKLESFKLQIELIEHQNLNNNEIEDMIMKVVITFPLEIEVLKQVMMILNSYSHRNPTIAKNCLLYVFNNKLDFSNKEFVEIAESYIVSLIWMVTSQLKKEISAEKLKISKTILEISDKKMMFELTNDTTNCIIIMLWSMGKKKMKEECYEEALDWFDCCFVRFLKTSAGVQQEQTIGKIQRSMLQCCLKNNNYEKFTDVMNSMTESNKKNPLTLYYEFVKMLRLNINHDQIINTLSELSLSNDPKTLNLLALCVVESKTFVDNNNNSENESFIKEPLNHAIDKLLTKCNNVNPSNCDQLFLVALRSSVYIYGKSFETEIEKGNIASVEMIERSVNQMLNYARENIKNNINLTEISNDIEWFSSSCYNSGLMLLEKNILDIRGVKLFGSVIKLIDFINKNTEDNTKYLKWKCKTIIFKSFCEREILLKGNKDNWNSKWIEIYDQNQWVVDNITSNKEKEYKDIKFQSILLKNESLVNRNEWNTLIQMIKNMNEYSKDYNDDNQEIDILVENLLNMVNGEENHHSVDNNIMKLLDIIFIERGFKIEYKVDINMLFKWIHMLLNKMIYKDYYEDKLLDYISFFKESLSNLTESDNKKLKNSEIEWLAGVCWNKGIDIILRNKQNGSENVEDEDITMEDSFSGIEERSLDKISHVDKNVIDIKRNLRWCEIAIKIMPERPSIPERHPSLILNDKISDAGMTFKCGCKGGKCIKETANWLYGPNGEINNPQEDCTKTEAYHFKNLIHDSVGRQL
ncbi:protein transport protein S31 [Pichia californica]|uniref:Protein transport protein SEC31 n=1 Tax=Pichia californica TaxID=460514 RepID=A0A9P6WKK2_9ASCO|nr:protein transport protein S31 [[Candida] californica]